MITEFETTTGHSKTALRYHTKVLQPVDPVPTLEGLISAGLAQEFWIYTRQGETLVGANALGRVTVTTDNVKFEWRGSNEYLEPANEPFGQVEQIFRRLPLANWRAFGHIAFDLSGFYLPYALRAPIPLLRFSIPQTELRITSQSTTLRTTLDPDLVSATWRTTPQLHNCPRRIIPDTSDCGAYVASVMKLTEAIRAGRLSKAILARRVRIPGRLDLLATYAVLRSVNPTARTFCFKQAELSGAGASPEILIQTGGDGTVLTNPLAGTRRRGKTQLEDDQLREELREDPKEIKEHVMSVVLAQDELKSVCRSGTVRIGNFMDVLKFRYVQHLSSAVMGQLEEGKTCWDALRVLFPGVTVSGVGKREALAQIAELEIEPRGAYGGCVGWVDSDGASDLAIAIRSAFEDSTGLSINAGAGIVAESVPRLEYEESAHKMQMMLTNIVLAAEDR
jgi:salicylate synthetase